MKTMYNKQYTLDQLRNKIVYYIKFRFRSRYQIIQKLTKLNATEDQKKAIVQELEELELINDEKFIIFFIKELIELKKFGMMRVKSELKQKGFDNYIIEDALNKYLDEESYSPEDEVVELLTQKYRNRLELPDDQKILAYLGRRGFMFSVAMRGLEEYKKNREI